MSQQAPIIHRNRWRSEGLREESGTEKSLQFAGKQFHSNLTTTVFQPTTLSGERFALRLRRRRLKNIHSHVCDTYISSDHAGACSGAGATLSSFPRSISIPMMPRALDLCYTFPSLNTWVSAPANSQQCLNDSIIDTERSSSEIAGHSPPGFPSLLPGNGAVNSLLPTLIGLWRFICWVVCI